MEGLEADKSTDKVNEDTVLFGPPTYSTALLYICLRKRPFLTNVAVLLRNSLFKLNERRSIY